MTPRCGRPMQRYEACNGPMPEEPACGRPAGHNGRCRTVQALRREGYRQAWSDVPCACGCGEYPSRGHGWLRGHNNRAPGGWWERAA